MIAFIDDHRQTYGVEPICRVLPIAPSTYHAHAARRADPERLPARAKRDAVLMAEIRRVHVTNLGVYGVRKVLRQLAREGIAVARCTVAAAHRDHDTSDNADANLAAFCQRCHLIHDRPEHQRRRWRTLFRRKALGNLFDGPYA